MDEGLTLEPFLEYIIKNLANHPEEVKIRKIDGKKDIIFEVYTHPEDLGKVIGKSGSVVRAIRNIITAINSKEKKNYILEIID